MIPCPHCGTENSAKKRVCHHCQQELAAPAPDTPAAPPPAPRRLPALPRLSLPHPAARPARTGALGVPLLHRAQFFRQLHQLLKAGIPLILSLGHLENQLPPRLRPMVSDMTARVQRGELLSATMASYPAIFQEWEIYLMRAAEMSGDLAAAADEIATTLELEADLRRRINSATFHIRATVVVFILVLFILTAVRTATGGAAGVLAAIEGAGMLFLQVMAVVVLVWQGLRLFGYTRGGRSISSVLLPRLPFIGPLLRNMTRARFARVLGALWNAGVGPMEALHSASRACGDPRAITVVEQQMSRAAQGVQMSDVVEEMRLFSTEMVYLLRTGETTGAVPVALHKIAEYYQIEIDAQAKVLPTQMYITFFFLIAIVIGYTIVTFVLEMLQPVFELVQ